MTHPEIALERILQSLSPLEPEDVLVHEAAGRVIARDLGAPRDLPPFDHATSDGYAVVCGDVEGACGESPARLLVRETLLEGDQAPDIAPGLAVPLSMGRPVPEGADAVVAREATEADGPLVRVLEPVRPGAHILRGGADVRAGEVLLARGAVVRPFEVALAALQGLGALPVVRRPRVGLLAGSADLWARSEALGRVPARGATGPAAFAALSLRGALPEDLGVLAEGEGEARDAIDAALRSCDALVLSGSLSDGAPDRAAAALLQLGLEPVAWGLAMEPGRSFFFGMRRGKPVFGLPGAPAAFLICLEEFVRPAVERLQGLPVAGAPYGLSGTLEGDWPKEPAVQLHLLCEAAPAGFGYRVRPVRPQGPHLLGAARRANALARVPIGPGPLRSGHAVSFRWLL